MSKSPTTRTDISPKVTASTAGSALGIVLAWILTQVPVVDHAPAAVQGAMVVLIIAGLAFAGGYLKRD